MSGISRTAKSNKGRERLPAIPALRSKQDLLVVLRSGVLRRGGGAFGRFGLAAVFLGLLVRRLRGCGGGAAGAALPRGAGRRIGWRLGGESQRHGGHCESDSKCDISHDSFSSRAFPPATTPSCNGRPKNPIAPIRDSGSRIHRTAGEVPLMCSQTRSRPKNKKGQSDRN